MKEHTKRLQALLDDLRREEGEKKKGAAVLDPDAYFEEFEAGKTIEDSGIIERIFEGSDL